MLSENGYRRMRHKKRYTLGMRIADIFLLFTLFIIPWGALAAPLNVGFVQGLWYAHEPVFAGVPNRMYVAFRNNTPDDLTGTINFAMNGALIGSSDVRVLSGRVTEAWVDWTPVFGEQTVQATVVNVALHRIGGETVSVEIPGLTTHDTRTVDRDTDKDETGDALDEDDDNDGISDKDEKDRGTNPLVAEPKTESTDAPATHNDSASEAVDTEGFERFFDGGVTDALLSSATNEIHDAKQAIDSYRAERDATTNDDLIPEYKTSGDGAVITRSTMETKTSFWDSLITGGKALISHLWTFILWLLSSVLAHPIFVQLLILLSILYGLFYTARRFGRRPGI